MIAGYWERAELPRPLFRRLGELGLVGEDIDGYGCPALDPIARGLLHLELHRGDGSLGTFLGVQAGLAMKTIALLGSEAQRERWLPALARVESIGAFALTEPDHGSDSVALETTARRDGDECVIHRAHRRPRAGDEPSAWRQQLQGHGTRARRDPRDLCLGGTRTRGRRLRRGAHLHQAPRAVRPPAVQLPDRPGPTGEDARGAHRDAAVLPADRSLHTYEGTETMQTLIVGRDITGTSAFT